MSTTRELLAATRGSVDGGDDGRYEAVMMNFLRRLDIFLFEMNGARAYGGAIGVCCVMMAIGCEQPVAPRATTMSAMSATSVDAVAGQAIRPGPTVVVRDAAGQPVAGIRVTFFDP